MITEETILQFKTSLERKSLSQAEAARRLGVGATHLNQILQGKRRPSLDLLEKMAAMSRSAKAG